MLTTKEMTSLTMCGFDRFEVGSRISSQVRLSSTSLDGTRSSSTSGTGENGFALLMNHGQRTVGGPFRYISTQILYSLANICLPMQVDDPSVFEAILYNIVRRQDTPIVVWDGKGLSGAGALCQLTSQH